MSDYNADQWAVLENARANGWINEDQYAARAAQLDHEDNCG